jgi:hypothetical protein
MRTALRLASGLLVGFALFSCEKSTEIDPQVFDMDLVSKAAPKNLYVGMEYQGGIIFYLDETGKHGLITAKEDVGPAPWGCYGTSFPEVSAAADSKTASKLLLANCKEKGIAARLCAKYEVREKGKNGRVYKDWYMAGRLERSQIIRSLGRSANFCGKKYWNFEEAVGWQGGPKDPGKWVFIDEVGCTTPENPDFGWGFFTFPKEKSATAYARPIRSF